MATTDLKIDALDFDQIKENLKTYLKTQDQFKDYDFEGSGLNILLDLLAYNTYYSSYYANMVANETFIDSATLRESVTSIAKHLNYLPKSYRSAVAYVNVEYLSPSANFIQTVREGNAFLVAGETFVGIQGSRTFLFYAATNTKLIEENGSYWAKNVEIKQGLPKATTYVFDNNQNVDQKFVIPDINVDTTSVTVRVNRSITDTTGIENLWTRVTDINKLGSDSQVFFLQINADNYYEVHFGDGIIGQLPDPGNVITVSYTICDGSTANGIGVNDTSTVRSFRYLGRSQSQTTLVIDSEGNYTPSFGGSEPESIPSVKYYAPRNYQAQGRAVTAEDYRTLLHNEYGEQADSVFVWGGEDNDPPIYGKVFVSIKPRNAQRLTQLQKLAIAKNILKERNVVSILPEVVDPDYMYMILDVTIKYNTAKTTLTAETLEQNIKNLLYLYGGTNIGKFDRDFNESQFLCYVTDNYNPPVVSCSIDLQLKKRFEPNLSTITNYTINFDNALYHPIDGYDSILTSSGFGYQDSTSEEEIKPNVDAYLDDDGNGNVRIYKLVSGSKIFLNETAGTIDYTTGKVELNNFIPQYLNPETQTDITITVIPDTHDIVARRNQILMLENEDISVTAVPYTYRYDSSSGSAFNGTN